MESSPDTGQADPNTQALERLSLEKLSLEYERFRMPSPSGSSLMEKTMRDIGQISPITISHSEKKGMYAIIDGIKRYHAAKGLKMQTLLCRLLKLSAHAQKVAIIQLNHSHSSVSVIEESLIISSLHRDNGLTQSEIAALFGHHKSWVCRRIAMTERLCDEAIENLRLGLIKPGVARELSRLPRGNQAEALKCILKHRVNCKEARQLSSLLLSEPSYNHNKILWLPLSILDARNPPRPRNLKSNDDPGEKLALAIETIGKGCKQVEIIVKQSGALALSDILKDSLYRQFELYEQIITSLKIALGKK